MGGLNARGLTTACHGSSARQFGSFPTSGTSSPSEETLDLARRQSQEGAPRSDGRMPDRPEVLEEPGVDGEVDGVAAGRRAKLVVDRERLRLDRRFLDPESLPDLLEGEVVGQEARTRSSATVRPVAPRRRLGARVAKVAWSASTSAGRTPRSGRSRSTSRACVTRRSRRLGRRPPGGRGRTREGTGRLRRGPPRTGVVAGPSRERARDAPRRYHRGGSSIRCGPRETGRSRGTPRPVGAGSIASLSATRAAAASQAPRSAATRARCPSTQYQIATSPDDRAATIASAKAASAPARSPIVRRAKANLPEREVPPGAIVPFELDRPGGIRQRIVGALAGHGGSEHRPPGLE